MLTHAALVAAWISEAEAWKHGLKFYTDGLLFEGKAGSGVLSQELDLKAYKQSRELSWWVKRFMVFCAQRHC
jgi:hypothetical protein